MNKITIIIIALVALAITTSAQTKPKVKSVIKKSETFISPEEIHFFSDTVYVLNPTDVLARLVNIKNIITVAMQPNDVTPNQRTQAMHTADSLFKADLTWYNKIKAPKPAPAAVPAKQ